MFSPGHAYSRSCTLSTGVQVKIGYVVTEGRRVTLENPVAPGEIPVRNSLITENSLT